MPIVETIHDGATTVYIHDDCCRDTTPEEVKEILDRIARKTLPYMRAAMLKNKKEETA